MKYLSRLLITLISGVSALYFVFWSGGVILFLLHLPIWPAIVVALAAAAAASRYVWTHTATLEPGLFGSIVLGALGTGGVGFAGGFFGPIILTPSANQGPLLGLFVTGPLGVVLGAVGGAIYWLVWGRRAVALRSAAVQPANGANAH
jgi:hypothetical protein